MGIMFLMTTLVYHDTDRLDFGRLDISEVIRH